MTLKPSSQTMNPPMWNSGLSQNQQFMYEYYIYFFIRGNWTWLNDTFLDFKKEVVGWVRKKIWKFLLKVNLFIILFYFLFVIFSKSVQFNFLYYFLNFFFFLGMSWSRYFNPYKKKLPKCINKTKIYSKTPLTMWWSTIYKSLPK